MRTSTLPNVRATSDIRLKVRLKDGGVALDWSGMTDIRAYIFSDAQKAMAGRCVLAIDREDETLLLCDYASTKPQYLGINRIVLQCKYDGRTKTYDKAVMNIVARTEQVAGEEITIDDPELDVEIDVEDVSSSILDGVLAACIKATEEAKDIVDIHRGPQGPKGDKGDTGAQGQPGERGPAGVTSVAVTVDSSTGTPAAESSIVDGALVIRITGIKGEQGNSGYQGAADELEVVNNRTQGGAAAALSAEVGRQFNKDLTGELTLKMADFDDYDHYKDGKQLKTGQVSLHATNLDDVAVLVGANYKNVKIPVEGYDYVEIYQYSSSSYYGSCMVDENGMLVARISRTSSDSATQRRYIPTDAKFLIYSYNVNNTDSSYVKLVKAPVYKDRVLDGAVLDLKKDLHGAAITANAADFSAAGLFPFAGYGQRKVSGHVGESISAAPWDSSTLFLNFEVPLAGWNKITYYQNYSSVGAGSAFLDADKKIIQTLLKTSSPGTVKTIAIPEGAAYFWGILSTGEGIFKLERDSGTLDSRLDVMDARIDEIAEDEADATAQNITGLTPSLAGGYISDEGVVVEDAKYVTTAALFGPFYLKLADGYVVDSAHLFDRAGRMVSYQYIHPDVFHASIRSWRDFMSTGRTLQQYGYRVVIKRSDGNDIPEGATVITTFVNLADAGLHRWVPSNLPNYDVALRRIDYLQNLTWVPLAKVPDSYGQNVANNYFCRQGQLIMGVPYSDVAETRKYVPNNVSIRTFQTATKNKRSLLYTEELQNNVSKYGLSYTTGNRRCYYGEVCSGFTAWVMGLDTLYLSRDYNNVVIPGLSSVSNPSAETVRPLDFMWSDGHITIISDIWLDEFGATKFIVVAEMSTPYPYRTLYTPEQFNTRLSDVSGKLRRWNGWENVPEPPALPNYSQYQLGALPFNFPYCEDIMTFAGDYASFADGDKIVLNARRAGTYTGVELYKDGELLQTIDISEMEPDGIYVDDEDWVAVDLTSMNLQPGKYRARLTDGTDTTDYTYFEVVGINISAAVVDGGLQVTFSSVGGTPVSIERTGVSGFASKFHPVTAEEALAGQVTLSGWSYSSTSPYLYILSKGDYGTVCKHITIPEE
jgi:hypothetical protein